MKARRTQQERREGTVRKLLDAAAEALIEDGYAGASVQRIAARAEVSQGGLFRHFPTREALMVAVAEDVGRQLLARFSRQFNARARRGDPTRRALALLRAHCHSRSNQAWYELSAAARTDPGLSRALRPIAASYYREIEALAATLLPELASALGPRFPVLVHTAIAIFDGEALHRGVLRRPALERARLELVGELFAAAGRAR